MVSSMCLARIQRGTDRSAWQKPPLFTALHTHSDTNTPPPSLHTLGDPDISPALSPSLRCRDDGPQGMAVQ